MTTAGGETQWKIIFHAEFVPEFTKLSEPVRQKIIALAELLTIFGPRLARPKVDTLKGSRHSNMKELRFDAEKGVWRVAFAFDLKRRGILLVCGDKSGVSQSEFYRKLIQVADRRFSQHQRAVSTEREKR
jgi:hypothetical protein